MGQERFELSLTLVLSQPHMPFCYCPMVRAAGLEPAPLQGLSLPPLPLGYARNLVEVEGFEPSVLSPMG